MKGTWIGRCCLFLVLALLTGCSLPAAQTGVEEIKQPTETAVFEPVTLQVGYMPVGPYLPLYVGMAKGFFAEQGLTIELQSFRTGGEMIAPLALGQLDVGGGEAGTAFYNAINQKMAIRAVIPLGFLTAENSYLPIVVRKDLYDSGTLDSLSDLKGKQFAINNPRGMTEWLISKAMEAGGWTIDDVEIVTMPFPEMPQALENKAIDAALLQYPAATMVINPGPNGEPPIGVLLVGTDEVSNNPQITTFYFGERLLAPENREIGVRFCVALLNVYRFIVSEDWMADEEVIALMSEITQSSPELIRAGVYPGYDPNGRFKVDSLADIQRYFVERGYTEYDEVIPMDQVIDFSFWEEALARVGEVQP